MKNIFLVCSLVILIGCQQNQEFLPADNSTEKLPEIVPTEQTPKFSLENLSKKQRKTLDGIISPKTREIFENSEQIILTGYSGVGTDIKKVKVFDRFEKRDLLDSLYEEATQKSKPIECKPIANTIEADFEGKTALIKFDFRCGVIISDGYTIQHGKEFERIFKKLLEKNFIDMP